MRLYQVAAEWDGDAGVWVATSDDVPGLVAEAVSREALVKRLRSMVPELLELNRHLVTEHPSGRYEIKIHWVEDQRLPMYA
jgi:predicted RNase H-like HicB family nuclease